MLLQVETKDQAIQTLNAKIKMLEKEVQTLKEEKERLEKLVNESGDNAKSRKQSWKRRGGCWSSFISQPGSF